MTKEEDKTTVSEKPVVEKTPEGQVYNFTRHNFVVVAKSLEEAEKALSNHLKESKEAK